MPRTPSLNPKPKAPSARRQVAVFLGVLVGAILLFVIGLSVAVLVAAD